MLEKSERPTSGSSVSQAPEEGERARRARALLPLDAERRRRVLEEDGEEPVLNEAVVARQHGHRRARPREAGDVLLASAQHERPLMAPRASSSQPSADGAKRGRGGLQAVGHRGERSGDLAEHAVLPAIEKLDADDRRAPRRGDAEHLAGRSGLSRAWSEARLLSRLGHLAHEAAVPEVAGRELRAHAAEEVNELRDS